MHAVCLAVVAAALGAPISPDEAVASALASNPGIALAEGALAVANGLSRQSAFLGANPEFEFGYALVGERVDASLAQQVSLSGEGIAAHRSALVQAAAATARLERARLDAAATTRSAYVVAVVAHRTAGLAQAAFDLASRQVTATVERVRVGETSDLDLRLARLAQARAAHEQMSARGDEATALATLATLVGRPVAGTDLAADPLAAAPEVREAELDERADVRAARFALEAAEAAVRREQAAAVPSVRLGAFYENEGGVVVAGPSAGLVLPLWHQNQAGVAEARSEVGIARAELAATAARATAEAQAMADAHANAAATMATVHATDEDAASALSSIEAAALSGEFDLVTTILLRGEVVEGQRALTAARGDLALARITLLLATDNPSLLAASP